MNKFEKKKNILNENCKNIEEPLFISLFVTGNQSIADAKKLIL